MDPEREEQYNRRVRQFDFLGHLDQLGGLSSTELDDGINGWFGWGVNRIDGCDQPVLVVWFVPSLPGLDVYDIKPACEIYHLRLDS